MALNTTDKLHVYAASPSDEIVDWEEEIVEKAGKKGIEYDGPISPPREYINGKMFRKRIFRFSPPDRARELLATNLPDTVYIKVSVGTTIKFNVENIVPDEKLPKRDCSSSERIGDEDDNDPKNAQPQKRGSEDEATIREDTESTSRSQSDIDDLREQAEDAAIKSVPTPERSSQQLTQEYTRSPEVRRYVMARADGECEGCDEPAPFTSKTGDAYLHAHHINELSDGGSDTPDTVIALCPNCHYKVHHGEKGEGYNEKLRKKLNDIEFAHKHE